MSEIPFRTSHKAGFGRFLSIIEPGTPGGPPAPNTQVFLGGTFLQFPKKSSPRFPPGIYPVNHIEQELALLSASSMCRDEKYCKQFRRNKSGWTAHANKALYKTGLTKLARLKDSLQTTNAKAAPDWHHQWWDSEEQRTENVQPSLLAILPPLLHSSPCILHNVKQRKMVGKLQTEENYACQELPETSLAS